MYCSKCGREIMDTDKFCPFCGESFVKKKIVIDSNANAATLKKRAFLLLEDGDFLSAKEYLEHVLSQEPEDGEAYLGLLMVETKQKTRNDLFNYYENLYTEDDYDRKEVSYLKENKEHVDSIIKEYEIPKYLDRKQIEEEYDRFLNGYDSLLSCRQEQKAIIEKEFNNNNNILRIRNFDKKLKLDFDKVLKTYTGRIDKARKEDEKKEEEIKKEIPSFIENTDNKIKKLYEEALEKREEDYKYCVEKVINSTLLNELRSVEKTLINLDDFKDAQTILVNCRQRISELEEKERIENELREAKKKRIIMMCIAAVAVVILAILYNEKVIVPKNKYNEAIKCIDSGEYDKAIDTFLELGDYSDSKEKIKEAKYAKANYLLNKGDYQEALDIFSSIDPYEDSETKIKEAKYELSLSYMSKKDFDKAIELLSTIESYEDSTDKIKEAKYQKAIVLRENKKYDEAVSLFTSLGDFKDSAEQIEITEKEKNENSSTVPNLIGKTLEQAQTALKKIDLAYTVTESAEKNKKIGTVISTKPKEGELVLKGTVVDIVVAKGSSSYSNYAGDGNTKVLFQVNISPSGNNLRVRSAPTTADDNVIKRVSGGDVFNVYETKINENYTWYRIGSKQWIANNDSWVLRDRKCDSYNGDFTKVTARIDADDHIGVYDNPVEDGNRRNWVRSIYNGETITIYYRFDNGSHRWYKVGADEWIKDAYGDKVTIIR